MGQKPAAVAGRLTLRRLAWRHITGEPASAVVLVVAIALALTFPALPLVIDGAIPSQPSAEALAKAGAVVVQRSKIADAAAFDGFQRGVQRQLTAGIGAYLDAGAEFADAASLRIYSVNGQPPSGGGSPVRAAYASDLPARIAIVKGELAKPVANSVQGTVSMALDAASQLGLGLGDVVCLGSGADQSQGAAQWCARLVGLWRALAPGDSYWRGRTSAAVFTDRDDFFSLLTQASAQGASGGRWYMPRAAAITAANAADVADRLRLLRETVSRAGTDVLQTDLDRSLDRYSATGRLVTFSVRLLSGALVVLSILLVAALAGHFLDIRGADLAVLGARGWSAGRVRRLALTELAAALLLGLLATTIVALLAAVILPHAWPTSDGFGSSHSLPPIAVATGATLAGILVCLGAIAARPLRHGDQFRDSAKSRSSSTVSQRLIYVNVLLAAPAALLFFLPDRLAVQRWPGGASALEADRFVVFVAALVLLSGAALGFLQPVATGLAGLAAGASGTLARLRLGDWWRRNLAAGFLLIFAGALATFAAAWLAGLIAGGAASSSTEPGLSGLAASLAGTFGAAALTVLAIAAFLANTNVRSRAGDDARLLVDGLPARTLRRAHSVELRAVLGLSAVASGCLGLALALSMSARVVDSAVPLSTAAVGLGLAATPVVLYGGGLLFSRLARPSLPRPLAPPAVPRSS